MSTIDTQTPEITPAPSLKHAVKFGAIIAGINIVITVLLYAVSTPTLVSLKFVLLILVLNIGFLIYGGLNYRKTAGGYLTYSQSYLWCLVFFTVSLIIGTIFNLVLYNLIDPTLSETLTEATIENTEQMLAGFGTPQESIDLAVEKARLDTPAKFTPAGQLKGAGIGVIVMAVLSLLFALIFRKSPPLE